MIVIKKDRGWVKAESWEEVESLPGYIRDIDPKVIKLEDVIGSYREPEFRVCGLSTCHTKHYKGFIVSLEDGRVTNIGADCGSTHLGVEFDQKSRQLDRDWASQERREAITSAKNRIEQWQNECQQIRNEEHGASWLIKQNAAMNDKTNGLPESVTKFIYDAIKTGDHTVYRERSATEQEKEIARETGQGGIQFIKEDVGTLAGLNSLAKVHNLRDIFVSDVEIHLNTLERSNVDELLDKDLRFWAKWCSEVDSKLDQVRTIVRETQKFFTRENIGLLMETVQGEDRVKVMQFAQQYN